MHNDYVNAAYVRKACYYFKPGELSLSILLVAMRILFCSCLYAQFTQKGFRLSHGLCILSCSLLVMHILFCSCLCKVHSRVSDALSWASWNLSFLADLTLSDSTALISFIAFANWNTLCFSFGSKDMITAFTCLPSYRCSFTLRAYLCWRHTYCQRRTRKERPLPTWSKVQRFIDIA